MQKLESEPAIEFSCFNRACEEMRERGASAERLQALLEDCAGYSFVDACLRALAATGWLNFRMRAMLVSFAAYDLWLDWRNFAHPLVVRGLRTGHSLFAGADASGSTGINTLRIYNPIKQVFDHDPEGAFMRRWVPELAGLPGAPVHESWKATHAQAAGAGLAPAKACPRLIMDHAAAVREARTNIARARRSSGFREEAARVQAQHGSRAGGRGSRNKGRRSVRFGGLPAGF